jgi:hypothetical protein
LVPVYCDFSEADIRFLMDEKRKAIRRNPPWFARVQGNVVKLFRTGCERPPHIKRHREPVGPWSHQSRMNLLRKLNVMDYEKIPASLFVTLTYPDGVDKMPYRERSKHRAVFARHVETYFRRPIPMVWRIEWEERKSGEYTGKLAPHFHVMMFNVRRIPWQLVREWWRASIGAGYGPLKTWLKHVYGQDGALRYLSKYVSKYRSLDLTAYHNSGIEFGRHWGILRPALIPLCPVMVERQLTAREIKIVRQWAYSRWDSYDPESGGGFTVLGPELAKSFAGFLNSSGQKASA